VNESTTFNGPVATFTDLNAAAATSDFTANIDWGDGHHTTGTVTANGGGVFTVSGTNKYTTPGTLTIHVLVQDFGRAEVSVTNTAVVKPLFLVTGAGAGGGPEVKVYDAVTGAIKFDFFAYSPTFTGGITVATGDVDGDNIPDIIVAPSSGMAAQIE